MPQDDESPEAKSVHSHDGEALEVNPVVEHHDEPLEAEPADATVEDVVAYLEEQISEIGKETMKLMLESRKTEDNAAGRKRKKALLDEVDSLGATANSLKQVLAAQQDLQQSGRVEPVRRNIMVPTAVHTSAQPAVVPKELPKFRCGTGTIHEPEISSSIRADSFGL